MKRLFSLPIRVQLLLTTLAIAVPALTIIIYVGLQQRDHAVGEAYTLTRLLAERIAAEQKTAAAGAEQLLVTLAQMAAVQQQDHKQVQPLLLQLQQLNPRFANILVADRSGKVWAAAQMPPPPSMVDDRRYFKNALATGSLSSGEYVVSKSMARPAFHFAYPYRDTAGVISGVIVVAFGLDRYTDILNLNRFPEGTNFLLLDHNGVILNRAILPEKVIGKRYDEKDFKAMQAGPDEDSYRGMGSLSDERFITYRKIRLAGETSPSMYVRVGVPVKTALAAANRSIGRNLAFFASFLVAAFALAYLLAKYSIADRVNRLQEVSRRLAQGDLQIHVADEIQGGELGHLAQSFDFMAHQLAERARVISESEARLRSITDSAQDAILMMDTRGAISFWNPAAETILGYSADEALGKDLHQLLTPVRYQDSASTAFADFVRTGDGPVVGKTVELDALRKDGQEITVSLSLSSVFLDGGWHAVGILRDITELKRYQDDLLEARHAADAANRAKSEFLANMSHEIRTPMNGVVGMTQLLRFTQPSREQEEYLDSLELSCENLLVLINDILDLSRVESGKLELETTDFSPRRCIDEVVANQSSRIKLKGLQLNSDVEAQVPLLVQGDGLRFKQILLNLLGNAIKFTETGSVSISLSALSRDEKSCSLQLVVRDTGIGMTADMLERIFNPFEQADNSTTRVYGGSGLGLAICRRLVGLMGGRIWAESTAGQGTAFFVDLPFGIDLTSALPAPRAADDELQLSQKPQNILIAEDNRLNADTVLAMLKRLGHQAGIAGNGREALEMWHASAYTCILMDISMPVMDGHQALATIREQERKMGGHTPVIALTAHALRGDREQLLAEGFDGYIAKPVQMQELASELARVTAR